MARPYAGLPLAQAARVVGSALLPLAALVALPTVGDNGPSAQAAPIALVVASAGLAWEATRRGRTWWFGAAASLLVLPFVCLALAYEGDHPLFVAAVAATGWIALLAARRLDSPRAVVWDAAAVVPALLYPLAAWETDWSSAALFANAAILAGAQAFTWRSPFPLYALVLAVDGLYVKLLDIYGSPDSPAWRLGAALWPLGIGWAVLAVAFRGQASGPFALAALLTLMAAALLVIGQHPSEAGIALSAAVATIAVAWRLRLGPVLLAAVPWLLFGDFAVAAALDLHWAYGLAATGFGGWLLLAVSEFRPPPRPEPPAPEAAPVDPADGVDATAAAPTPAAIRSSRPEPSTRSRPRLGILCTSRSGRRGRPWRAGRHGTVRWTRPVARSGHRRLGQPGAPARCLRMADSIARSGPCGGAGAHSCPI